MNSTFKAFVEEGRMLAAAKGINWEIRLDHAGRATKTDGWNLTEMSGGSPPPMHRLLEFGTDSRTMDVINATRLTQGKELLVKRPLSRSWQDLIKACVLDQIIIRRNTTSHVLFNIVGPLRVVGSAVDNREPWEITADAAAYAYETAKKAQACGKLAELVLGVINSILDANHLTDVGPLSSAVSHTKKFRGKRARFTKSFDELRSSLDERKNAEKLPERRAFWELVRIVFTETPRSFLDLLRFAQVRLMIATGIRVGEAVRVPADWKRFRDYYDSKGRSAGESGGYARSLLLRHFAEKSRSIRDDSVALFENTVPVLAAFEETLTSTLDQIVEVTSPLRQTLKRQVETGRIFPEFEPNDLVPILELYTRLTGNPFLAPISKDAERAHVAAYRADFRAELFEELYRAQGPVIAGQRPFGRGGLNPTVYTYLHRFNAAPLRMADGSLCPNSFVRWNSVYVRIGELEEQFASRLATKQSDSTPLKLAVGELQAWELMFLMPKRALVDGRNDGLCDITRYCAVGRVDSSMMTSYLCGESHATIFTAYGQNDEDKHLQLNPHQLRHLQNTELFRLGVADTIITKRFNRRSVAQSYEYDHRSLSEELQQIELPPEVEIRLGERASTVARMMLAGRGNGPIVEAFRRIQVAEGDDAAFDYLKAEADGFHSTPYGHCLNSFTVDPCPKHLECFAGCRHLSATDLPENRRNLVRLEGQLEVAHAAAVAKKSGSVGRDNQILHAQVRIEGVRKLLATPAGERVFPDGKDLSQLRADNSRSVLDVG